MTDELHDIAHVNYRYVPIPIGVKFTLPERRTRLMVRAGDNSSPFCVKWSTGDTEAYPITVVPVRRSKLYELAMLGDTIELSGNIVSAECMTWDEAMTVYRIEP